MEVIAGCTGRRRRSEAERAGIAAESLAPGARVVDVARRRGVTRWQVCDWRRKLTAGMLAVPAEATGEPAFAALVVEPPAVVSTRTAQKSPDRIELVVAGVTVRVAADVEEAQLTRVIRAVRAASA